MGITSPIVMIANSSITIIIISAASNSNDTNNDGGDSGGGVYGNGCETFSQAYSPNRGRGAR